MKKKYLIVFFLLCVLLISGCKQEEKQYICSYNAYNCDDFSTRAEAQYVFEECGGINNDVHHLDADKDGLACEWNK